MPLSPWSKNNSFKRQQQLMDSVESPLRLAVYREKNRYIDASGEYAKTQVGLSDALYEDHLFNITDIRRTYTKRMMILMSNEVGIMFKAARPAMELKKEGRIEMFFREWFAQHGGERAKEIAETTRDDIRRALVAVSDMGEEVTERPAIVRILRARGLSAWRSNTIARTETHNAAMEASIREADAIRDETGVILLKEWIPAEDGRTRPAHAAMADSQPIPVGSKFLVGGESIDRPGQGSAANAINCRCVLVYSDA